MKRVTLIVALVLLVHAMASASTKEESVAYEEPLNITTSNHEYYGKFAKWNAKTGVLEAATPADIAPLFSGSVLLGIAFGGIPMYYFGRSRGRKP